MATYFLDFDRTLFDTSAFLAYLIERDNLKELHGKTEVEQAALLNPLIVSGMVGFSAGELTQFFFPDAAEFLKTHSAESVVVTAGNPELQRAKCGNALAIFPGLKIFYADYESKGPFIARLEDAFPKPWTFVDDKPTELASVGTVHPETRLFQMLRRDLAPHGAYPVLNSFDELPE